MFREALLIVGIKTFPRISSTLELIAPRVQNRLYIRVQPPVDISTALPVIYLHASKLCSNLDVRVLLEDFPTRVFEHTYCEEDTQVFNEAKKTTPYDMVCLGGTFDMIHNGHKVLLSTAILKANQEVVCGITAGDMNKSK
jgi:hypothetical protein